MGAQPGPLKRCNEVAAFGRDLSGWWAVCIQHATSVACCLHSPALCCLSPALGCISRHRSEEAARPKMGPCGLGMGLGFDLWPAQKHSPSCPLPHSLPACQASVPAGQLAQSEPSTDTTKQPQSWSDSANAGCHSVCSTVATMWHWHYRATRIVPSE